jgi:uncharacterized protein
MKRMADRIDVLWHCSVLSSAEHGVIERTHDGWRLSGTVTLPAAESPCHIEYTVLVSESWTMERADIDVWVGPRRRSHRIEHLDGAWSVDGQQRPDLAACGDLDLGWTPMTNLIPMRRLGLGVGQSVEITAAWFRFPELDIVANEQRYTRLATNRWRYESGQYDFELVLDEHGIVRTYGSDLWRAVAVTEA